MGKRQRRGRRRFGLGKVTATIAERGETLLQVERHGIVDLGADAVLGQKRPHTIAIRHPHDELVVDVEAVRRPRSAGPLDAPGSSDANRRR